ncbi:MAG: alpha/beta hydrolase [Bryobacteraceae bacterium]
MLPARLRVVYLHGFASSPESRKAHFFYEQLQQFGFVVTVPDLAEGDFERLTISAQLRVIERTSGNNPIILIGSSLGGYLAALFATRHPEVDRLVLLAPAFDFHQLWITQLGPERLAAWRESGAIRVFHYAAGRELPLGYQFLEDASHFEPFPDFCQPTLIFHGNHDPVVPVIYSSEFVEAHANARLVQLESGHELTDVLDAIWRQSRRFLVDGAPVAE